MNPKNRLRLLLAAFSCLALPAQADVSISYLGADTTTAAAAWRSTSVAKNATFDLDGDNAYGTAGYAIISTSVAPGSALTVENWVKATPSFATLTATTGNLWHDAVYPDIDNVTLPISTTVADQTTPPSSYNNPTVTFTVNRAQDFVFSVLSTHNVSGPGTLTVTGPGGATATVTDNSTLTGIYSFDMKGFQPGDTFTLSATTAFGKFSAVAFDISGPSPSIAYLGADTTNAAAWRSTSVAKNATFDVDGDNAYGTAGYAIIDTSFATATALTVGTWIKATPSFATLTGTTGNLWHAAQYPDIDDVTLPINTTVADQTNPPSAYASPTVTFTINSAKDFVFSVFSNHDTQGPGTLTVTGPGGVSANVTNTTATQGMYFFDMKGFQPGDTFTMAATGTNAKFTAVAFDVMGPATSYSSWANGTFAPPLTAKLPGDNQDGDSLNNLQEFAFGTQPTVSTGEIAYVLNGSVTPGAPKTFTDGTSYSMVFGQRADYLTAGLTYTVQFSTALEAWVDNNDASNVPVQVATDGTINAMSVLYPETIETPSGPRKPTFSRVKVVLAP
ncbi:MAG: hypothetical protein ACRDBP_10920 [Luteolibacter sp.]